QILAVAPTPGRFTTKKENTIIILGTNLSGVSVIQLSGCFPQNRKLKQVTWANPQGASGSNLDVDCVAINDSVLVAKAKPTKSSTPDDCPHSAGPTHAHSRNVFDSGNVTVVVPNTPGPVTGTSPASYDD